MKKILLTFLYYVACIGAVIAAHKIDPTNLAGPGLDFLVYPFALIFGIILLIRSIVKEKVYSTFWVTTAVHISGILTIFSMIYWPF